MKKSPAILVCPLDWGIGHATRCVPVIKELLNRNVNVIIGADNRPLAFLKLEFPELKFIRFPGYRFSYPDKRSMAFQMILNSPVIFSGIRKERRLLSQIIRDNNIDAVISDNRFGLYTDEIPCIYISHQIFIKASAGLRFLEPVLLKLNRHYISKFDECWIPDFKDGITLSGDLAHKKPLKENFYYIGPLSRFQKHTEKLHGEHYDILIMLSGPEPQRTKLENILLEQVKKTALKCILISGKPEQTETAELNERITIFSHCSTQQLANLISNSDLVISRPGYSTIMDLAVFGKKAVFIPTPGQTEQEYLAGYFHSMNIHFKMDQEKFDLQKARNGIKDFVGINIPSPEDLLNERITALLSRIR